MEPIAEVAVRAAFDALLGELRSYGMASLSIGASPDGSGAPFSEASAIAFAQAHGVHGRAKNLRLLRVSREEASLRFLKHLEASWNLRYGGEPRARALVDAFAALSPELFALEADVWEVSGGITAILAGGQDGSYGMLMYEGDGP